MTTAHDFPDISLSSIGTNGSSPGRHGRLSTFDDDEFVSACSRVEASERAEVVPNSAVPSTRESVVPDSRRNTVYRESLSIFDDSDLNVSHALPPRRTRAAISPVLEEIDNQDENGTVREPRTLRFSQDEDGEVGGEPAVEAPPARIYPRLSILKDANFRHLDYTHLSQRKGSYRSQLQSPQSERSPALSSNDNSQAKPCDCGSQAHDKSSDQMYVGLERRFAEALNVSGSQQLGVEETNEWIMAGVVALIEARCCEEATILVRKRLRTMGATINRVPSAAVTHIIWSNGGDSSVLRSALDQCSQRPHVLPPAWVHESYSSGIRQPEAHFSLCDERYVSGVERRRSSMVHGDAVPHAANQTSSTIDISMSLNASNGNRTEFSDLTFDASMSVTQLLKKIDVMAKRLEKVETDPVQHAVRCASRTAAAAPLLRPVRPPFVPRALPRPLRRRSHDGFSLAHRAPEYDRQERDIRLASRDVLEVLPPLQQPPAAGAAAAAGGGGGLIDGVDDMRRTVETDLNRIRQTLRNNATFSRANGVSMRGGRGRGGGARRAVNRHLFSFVLPFSPRSPDRLPGRRSKVVVKTQSKMINQLQAVNSSEEFTKKRKETSRKRVAMLTGFGGREERHMLSLADAVQLRITKEMDDSLRAVVSSDGARTVSTLRAVVRGVPVVSEEWLRSCKRANRLLHTLPYEWPQWAELVKKRDSARRGIFAALGGKIKVCDFCSPSTPVLKELIMKSGGWLTSDVSSAVLIVAPQGVYRRREEREGVHVVEEKYILDCITENKLISLPGMNESLDLSLLSED